MAIVQSRLLACFAAFLFIGAPAFAQNNISLENLTARDKDGKTVLTLARVDVANTNLSRGEIAQLFSSHAGDSPGLALASRMTADKVTISGATLVSEGGKISFGPFEAVGIREGRFAKITLDGFTGAFSDKGSAGGGGSLTGRALLMENGNFAPVIAALQTITSRRLLYRSGGSSGAGSLARLRIGDTGRRAGRQPDQGLAAESDRGFPILRDHAGERQGGCGRVRARSGAGFRIRERLAGFRL